jgi:hypothetical protein
VNGCGEHPTIVTTADDGQSQLVGLVANVLLEQVRRGFHTPQVS